MARIKFPKLKGREMATNAGSVLAVGLGMYGSRMLSVKTIAPNLPEDSWWIKNEGMLKFGAGILLLPMIKNPFLKMAMIGMAVEGGLSAARSFIPEGSKMQIPMMGQGDTDDAYYYQEYQKMMGQFPGYGFTPAQVEQQLKTSVGNRGGTSPYTDVPMAVGSQF